MGFVAEGAQGAEGGSDDETEANRDDDEDEDDAVGLESIPVIPTAHARDAVDYSDFDETIADDQAERYYRRGMGILQQKATLPRSRLSLANDDYDEEEKEEEEEQPQATPIRQEVTNNQSSLNNDHEMSILSNNVGFAEKQQPSAMDIDQSIDIQQLFPGFEPGKILKFSELFKAKFKRPPKLTSHKRGKRAS